VIQGLSRPKRIFMGSVCPAFRTFYHQLHERKSEITLRSASNCWRIVVVFKGIDECLEFLQIFERDFLRWDKERYDIFQRKWKKISNNQADINFQEIYDHYGYDKAAIQE